MRLSPPQTELRILAFDPNTESDSPERPGYITHTNGYPFIGRLMVRNRLFWEIGLDDSNRVLAKRALLQDIEKQAAKVEVEALARALADELKWPEEAAIALAIAFLFPLIPSRLVGWRSAEPEKPRGRGRPNVADSLTRQIWHLLNAWVFVTGEKPATSRGTLFARAVGAAAEYLPIHIRYRSEPTVANADEIHRMIQREGTTTTSGHFIMVPPEPLRRINCPI